MQLAFFDDKQYERKRANEAKCEDRKYYAGANPEVVIIATTLYRKPRKGPRKSLRKIAEDLADLGYLNRKGNFYGPSQIKAMLSP